MWGLSLLKDFESDPYQFLLRWGESKDPLSRIRIGPQSMLLLKDPKLIKNFLIQHGSDVEKFRPNMRVIEQLDGPGAFTSEGEIWETQKKLILRAMGWSYLAHQKIVISRHTRAWLEGRRRDEDVDVKEQMRTLTLGIVCESAFGHQPSETESESLLAATKTIFRVYAREFFQLLPRPAWWPSRFARTKREAIRLLDAYVWARLNEKLASRGHQAASNDDYASRLLAGLDPQSPVAVSHLRNELMTMLIAGHDTTAASLSWCWLELCRSPDLQQLLSNEVQSSPPESLSAQQILLEAWPRLTSFLYETLRLYPPINSLFVRRVRRNFQIETHALRKGELVYISPMITQRSEAAFPRATSFVWDRFLKDGVASRPGEAWMPFGVGPHQCAGMQVALLEMKLVLGEMLLATRAQASENPLPGLEPVMNFSMWPENFRARFT
jgi:cytochrome P450